MTTSMPCGVASGPKRLSEDDHSNFSQNRRLKARFESPYLALLRDGGRLIGTGNVEARSGLLGSILNTGHGILVFAWHRPGGARPVFSR